VHVKGFTMRHPDVPEELRGTYAGLAHPANSTGRRNTSIWRCIYGTAKRMGSSCNGAVGDAFAGAPSGGRTRRPAAVLGGDRQGNVE
jgi:hypothetical protein